MNFFLSTLLGAKAAVRFFEFLESLWLPLGAALFWLSFYLFVRNPKLLAVLWIGLGVLWVMAMSTGDYKG